MSIPSRTRAGLIAVLIAAKVSSAFAAHSDVFLQSQGGQILTGISDAPFTAARVFTGELNELGIPGWTDDPGFNAGAGAFTPGTSFSFNALDGLLFWDGSHWIAPPNGETLEISFFGSSVSVDADSCYVAGFAFMAAGSGGGLHTHLEYYISRPDEQPIAVGAYVLLWELTSPSYSSSPLFTFVFNNELSAPDFAVAVAAADALVSDTLVGDINHDGVVGPQDLAFLLSAFLTDCGGDLDNDGFTDAQDLALLLSNWGHTN